MEAKVKKDYRWNKVTALGGFEFVKSEFRPVPNGSEKEAQAHPFLEVIADCTLTNNLVEDVQAEPEEETVEVAKVVPTKPKVTVKPKGGK